MKSAFAVPLKAYEPSPDTGSVLIVDANGDCVCMCDDVLVAKEIVRVLNTMCAACADGCSLSADALELLRQDNLKMLARK